MIKGHFHGGYEVMHKSMGYSVYLMNSLGIYLVYLKKNSNTRYYVDCFMNFTSLDFIPSYIFLHVVLVTSPGVEILFNCC